MGKIEKAKNNRSGRPAPAIAELVYDESARTDYLTGFHKRKLEKKKAAIEKWELKQKEERRELRKENNKRHLIIEDLERIESVTQERAADADELKETTLDVSTIPSSTRVTTVTISEWNPEDDDEEEEDEDEGDGGEASEVSKTTKRPTAEKAKSVAPVKRSAKKPRGITKVRTKANPHTKKAKEAKAAKASDKKKKRK
ncbi:hypothetical protein PhCBS80983_g01685 [Powellomyces hirtus]|uniref:Ribosomal RNA-processing protein 17 n=1 Tax=Powellomyces hirtus TaxID=109895 RepID=A0A507E9X2_9FUNG|nr:hypothetical protein PhCBS80983_g01685 [Powellomyces hirtus]